MRWEVACNMPPNTPQKPEPRDSKDDEGHKVLHKAVMAISGGVAPYSVFRNKHSQHRLPTVVSFSQLNSVCTAAQTNFDRCYVGGIGNNLYFTAASKAALLDAGQASGKKRARDEDPDVEELVDKSLVGLRTRLSDDDYDRVRSVLVRMRRDLRGSHGEVAVENVGVVGPHKRVKWVKQAHTVSTPRRPASVFVRW